MHDILIRLEETKAFATPRTEAGREFLSRFAASDGQRYPFTYLGIEAFVTLMRRKGLTVRTWREGD